MTPQSSSALYARLLSYVRPYAKTFGLAVLGMVAAAATEPLFPALIKPLLDGGFGARAPSTPAFYEVRHALEGTPLTIGDVTHGAPDPASVTCASVFSLDLDDLG